MTTFDIRPGTSADVKTLAQFNIAMAAETEDKPLAPEVIRKGVARMVEDPDLGFYLIAACEAGVIGCLAVTFEWSDWRCGRFWWIQSVYVDPAYRRMGVFRALYDHVTGMAKASHDSCGIRLYVERENTGAQHTYRQLGMIETEYKLFEIEFERDES